MRLLVISPTFLPKKGGAEVGIHEIYSRIARDHEVTILTPHLPDVEADEVSTHARYTVQRYSLPGQPGSLRRRLASATGLHSTKALLKLLREHRYDVINLHFIRPQGLGIVIYRLVAGRACPPMVLSLVARSDVFLNLRLLQRAYARVVISSADRIIANSHYYLQGSKYAQDPRVWVIPYGVELSGASSTDSGNAARDFPREKKIVVSIQRLDTVKRVELQIQAIAKLRDMGLECELVVVGRGPRLQSLQDMAVALGVKELVHFVGFVSDADLSEILSEADAFVFSSASETFGVVFAQAMAAGLPIVAMANTSIPEVVVDRVNGLLCTDGDSLDMARKLFLLLNDPGLMRRIGALNSQRAREEFDWDRIAIKYVSALQGS